MALQTAFMAVWEANGTLLFGYRKVVSVALSCRAKSVVGPETEARSADYVFYSLDPVPASQCCKRRLSPTRTQKREGARLKNLEKRL